MLEAQEIASKLDDGEINEWNDGVNAKIEEAEVQVKLENQRSRGEHAI